MAFGVVRASDQGAIWRTAINDDDFLQQKYVTDPASTPPEGADPEPASQPVAVSKSKKFLQPAKQLTTLLTSLPSPEEAEGQGMPAHAHQLPSFTQKYPSFPQTYFKPQYQDMLKAHLGEENYGKLLHHMSQEHHDALTTYAQQPAPKSNKFSIPANSLKKLLEDKNTTSDHLQQWMDKSTNNSTFADKYLNNPAYQDALKGHLGEKNYKELQKHLNVGETKSPSTPQAPSPQPPPSDQGDIDAMKAEMGGPSKSLGQQLNEVGAGFHPGNWDDYHQKNPEGAAKALKKSIETYTKSQGSGSLYDKPETAEKLQKIYDQFFGQDQPQKELSLDEGIVQANPKLNLKNVQKLTPKDKYELVKDMANTHAGTPTGDAWSALLDKHFSKGGQPAGQAPASLEELSPEGMGVTPPADNPDQHKALVEGVKKIFPNSNIAKNPQAFTVPEIQKQLETWQAHLDHPDHATQVQQLKDLHGQHFGPKGWSQNAPSEGQQQGPSASFSQVMEQVLGQSPGSFAALDSKPPAEKKQFLDFYYKTEGLKSKGHPELAKLYDHPELQEQQPSGLTKDILLKHFPHLVHSPLSVENWLQGGDQGAQKAKIQDVLNVIKDQPSLNKDPNYQAWQQLYQDAFGEEAPGHEKGQQSSGVGPQYHPLEKLKELAPGSSANKIFNNESFANWYGKYQEEGGKPLPPNALLNAYKKFLKGGQDNEVEPADPEVMKADFEKIIPGHKWQFNSPEDIKTFKSIVGDVLSPDFNPENGDFIDTPKKVQQVKDFFAKHFPDSTPTSTGGGQQWTPGGPGPAPSGQPASKPTLMDLLKKHTDVGQGGGGFDDTPKWNDHAQAKEGLDHLKKLLAGNGTWAKKNKEGLQKVIAEYEGGYDGPPLSWMKAHYPHSSVGQGTEQGVKDWWQQQKDDNIWSSAAKSWKNDDFGDKAQHQQNTPSTPTGGGGWDWSTVPSAQTLIEMGVAPGTAQSIAAQSPEMFQKNYQWAKDNPNNNDTWQTIAKYIDAQQGGTASTAAPTFDQIKDALTVNGTHKDWTWMGTPGHGGNSSGLNDLYDLKDNPEAMKAKLHEFLKNNYTKDHVQKVIDQLYGTNQPQQAAPDMNAIHQDLMNQFGWGNTSQGVQGMKAALEAGGVEGLKTYINDKLNFGGAGNGVTGKTKAGFEYVLSTLNGGGAAPAPKPAFDWSKFGPEFKAVYPNSNWAEGGDPGAASAQEKLKAALDQAQSQFPGTEKTQQAQALYDKWFGSGGSAPQSTPFTPLKIDPNDHPMHIGSLEEGWAKAGPDAQMKPGFNAYLQSKGITQEKVDNKSYDDEHFSFMTAWEEYDALPSSTKQKYIDQEQGVAPSGGAPAASPLQAQPVHEESEEEEGISAPAKSEKPKAAEVKQWAAAKPASPADWKNFATWWGKTKVTPKQEQAIYQGWFNKPTTPEAATKWFSQVYEYHSKPSSGDLGAEGMPAWAGNSWALGKNAEKEWPVFQQWAAKDPGIPKGLGIKSKLAIWNDLSAGDKKEIAENYLPAKPVDTQAVVAELQQAFPDSDFSGWATLGQGSLKTSVQTLTKAGFPEAIPIFNKYFDGNLEMPAAAPQEDAEAPKGPVQAFPTIPVEDLPQWIKEEKGSGFPNTPEGAQKYSEFKHWADSVGLGDWAQTGDGATYAPKDQYLSYHEKLQKVPSALVGKFNKIPPYLRKQVAAMPTHPWSNLEEFQAWAEQQPSSGSELQALLDAQGQGKKLPSYPWSYGINTYLTEKQHSLGAFIEGAKDPQTKQQLLGIYHKYFGNDKETLSQALEKVYPAGPAKLKGFTNWDAWLKTHSTDDVMKLLKKQFKAENDPEKFVMLADIWGKYFPHPDNPTYKTAPSGHAVVTSYLKNHHPGNPVSASSLKALHFFNAHGHDPAYYELNNYEPDSPYLKALAEKNDKGGYPAYHGWTPPGAASLGDFKPDPAMLATKGPTYAAPAEGPQGKFVQNLLETADKHKVSYSQSERAMMASEDFQAWFNHAPTGYKQAFQHHPGIAIDDYKAFMAGGLPYGEIPSPMSQKYYDVSPFANIPHPGHVGPHGEKWPKWLTYNPRRSDEVKFPSEPAQQETIPGVNWAPDYNPMPIYRALNPNIWDPVSNPRREKIRQQIVDILEGKNQYQTEQPNLFTDLPAQKWPAEAPPIPKTPDQWMDVLQWAGKNNISAEQMYDLAEKAGATPGKHGQPPLAKIGPNFDDPRLANLLLDFLENDPERHTNKGGMGIHWTRNRDKAYTPSSHIGGGSNMTYAKGYRLPISIHGLWTGQGEDQSGSGGAYHPKSAEQEHTLLSGAPVHVRRLQIRDEHGDWHDLIDYGPISTWQEGRDEHNIPDSVGSSAFQGELTGDTPTHGAKKSKDKPSLAETLTKMVGGKYPAELDQLKPGLQADMTFAKLVGEHPDKEEELKKIYWWFFVGRPDLPTKPHVRHASVTELDTDLIEARIERLAGAEWTGRAWAKTPTMLPGADMNITSVQIKHPVTNKWHEVLDDPQSRMAALEARIQRLAAAPSGGKRALIVVDPQNDFISGTLPVGGGERAAHRLSELMQNAKAAGYDHVITTQDWHHDPGDHWSATPDYADSWPEHGKANTWGAELHPALANLPVSERFYKGQNGPGYSGFEGTTEQGAGLHDWLTQNGVSHIDVAGLATDKCVHATARDGAQAGFSTRVLPHYSAPVTAEGEKAALKDLTTNYGVQVHQGPLVPSSPSAQPSVREGAPRRPPPAPLPEWERLQREHRPYIHPDPEQDYIPGHEFYWMPEEQLELQPWQDREYPRPAYGNGDPRYEPYDQRVQRERQERSERDKRLPRPGQGTLFGSDDPYEGMVSHQVRPGDPKGPSWAPVKTAVDINEIRIMAMEADT